MMDLTLFNPQQKEAVLHKDGPMMVLAGAGSGKTRVLTYRTAKLIDDGVRPNNILDVTFTNKAAGEMKQRIRGLVGEQCKYITISTFHSLCLKMLKPYVDRIGYNSSFSIFDTDDSKRIMRDIFKRLNLLDEDYLSVKEALAYIESAKNKMMTYEDVMQYEANTDDMLFNTYALTYELYQKELRRQNAMDFNDIIMNAVLMLENNPDILKHYQNQFKFIQVDEYQDTNHTQFELIKLLSGETKNINVVGDDDQSIYGFRGADLSNVLDFEKYFPNTKVVKLEQNYRSTKNIILAANEVIRENQARKDKTLFTDNMNGNKINLVQFYDGGNEPIYIVNDIKSSGYKYRDTAILYRVNYQAAAIEQELIRNNLPYRIIGGISFYSRAEIKNLLAYLTVVTNSENNQALERIINIPKRGIGQTSINKVKEYAFSKNISLWSAIKATQEDPELASLKVKFKPFVELYRDLTEKKDELTVHEFTDYMYTQADLDQAIEGEDEDAMKRVKENIRQFMENVRLYSDSVPNGNIDNFLHNISLLTSADTAENSGESKGGRVTLMTVHGAKGLEFKNVYIIGCEDGIIPYVKMGEIPNIEEERRLFYVAITRAKEKLTLTFADTRYLFGKLKFLRPSRFLNDLSDDIVDFTCYEAEETVSHFGED